MYSPIQYAYMHTNMVSLHAVMYRMLTYVYIHVEIAQLQKCCLQMLLYDTYIEALNKHIQTVCGTVYEKYCTVFHHCAVVFSHLVLYGSMCSAMWHIQSYVQYHVTDTQSQAVLYSSFTSHPRVTVDIYNAYRH